MLSSICSVSSQTSQLAGLRQTPAVAQWLRAQGAPWPRALHAVAITAAAGGAAAGGDDDGGTLAAAALGAGSVSFMCWRLEVLQWAVENGCVHRWLCIGAWC